VYGSTRLPARLTPLLQALLKALRIENDAWWQRRAAHALAFQRLQDSVGNVRDTRVLAHPTDAFLPFLAAPTSAALVVEPHHFTAGLRS
jgi:hypothetical protein